MTLKEISKKALQANLLILFLMAIGGVLCVAFNSFYPIRCLNLIYYYFLTIVFLNYVVRHVIYYPQRILAFVADLLMMILIILKTLRYHSFWGLENASRFLWYLYYIPIILIPLFLFYSALAIHNEKNILRTYAVIVSAVISFLLIILVCTNDYHQWIFAFQDGFENWENDYKRTPLFYVLVLWLIFIFFTAYFTMLYQCNILMGKRYSWLVVVYGFIFWGLFGVISLSNQLLPKVFSVQPFAFQEFYCAGAISFFLTSIRLWLIPADNDYNRLNDAIAEINDQLAEETELTRLRNELQEEQITVREKNELYNRIAEGVTGQSERILALSEQKENLPLMCFYGVYIKRLANLMLIASEQGKINSEELMLSVKESAKYLSFAGVPATVSGMVGENISSDQIITVYKAFQKILEKNLPSVTGILVHFYEQNNTVMKLVIEGITLANETAYLPNGVYCAIRNEDEATFVTVSLAKGGNTL